MAKYYNNSIVYTYAYYVQCVFVVFISAPIMSEAKTNILRGVFNARTRTHMNLNRSVANSKTMYNLYDTHSGYNRCLYRFNRASRQTV